MLDYAVALTRDPSGVGSSGVHALRAAGFRDDAILDVCQITAYYNYVNRLADGLDVGLEGHWTDEMMTLTREEFENLDGGQVEKGEDV